MSRKPIPKSVRFEVLKRDKFTCQYCGQMAPDVILEMDHVVPVSKGGTNDIMNLVCSCRDCNSGKSDRELSDDSAIRKQQSQLLMAAEHKEQIEMMLEWKKSMIDMKETEVEAAAELFKTLTSYDLTDHGKRGMAAHIKKFGLQIVLDGISTAYDVYWDGSEDGKERFFSKAGGVMYNLKQSSENPHYEDACSVARLAKNRIDDYGVWKTVYNTATEALETGATKDILMRLVEYASHCDSPLNAFIDACNGGQTFYDFSDSEERPNF